MRRLFAYDIWQDDGGTTRPAAPARSNRPASSTLRELRLSNYNYSIRNRFDRLRLCSDLVSLGYPAADITGATRRDVRTAFVSAGAFETGC